jgi:ankyrin repeat protein
MAGRGRVGAVALLADLGWDVDARATCRPHRETPLHQAAYGNHVEVVRELLARGADRTVRDITFDATPAGWAAHEGHTALAELLEPPGD